MNYTLIGSLTSPYVRKIRLLLHGTPYQFKAVNYTEEAGDAYLKSVNPINKLPVLLDGDITILESRVIYYYLSKKNNWKTLTIEEENRLSAIDAAMDSSINLFMLRRGGMDLNSGNSFIERQQARVPMILNHLTPWIKSLDELNPNDWNFLSMSLYSYLYWAKFREIYNLENHPDLKIFLQKFKNAPGVAETIILS